MKYVLNVKRCLRHLYALNTKSDQNSNTAFNTHLSKICHTYPTLMKLGTVIPYLWQMPKRYESRNTPLEFNIFSLEIRKFCCIKKYRYRLYFGTQFLILLTFFESLKIVLMNMVTILVISAKKALKRLGVNLSRVCGFFKNASSKVRVKRWFFVAFNKVISHIFCENIIEIP